MPPFQFFSEMTISKHQKSLTTNQQPRLLCLKDKDGTGIVACRIHDPRSSALLPTRTEPWGSVNYAWLSEEKMTNLTAVRGRRGARMVGPTDYFRDLNRSDQYLYTIDITPDGLPSFTEHPIDSQNYSNSIPPKKISDEQTVKVNAKWYSGFHKETLRAKIAEYEKPPIFTENIFPNSGIVEINGPKEIKLPVVDPRELDLSEYHARLVPNHEPFQITPERLHIDDEFCAIAYHYDEDYADDQVKTGGGNFLEFHQFAQTITPLDRDASGFVTLAKWNKEHTQLELIAIRIPYGYTLIIEKNCIHGDSTLNGDFLMCMTSDHVSMGSADTVSVIHATSKENISLKLDNVPTNQNHSRSRKMLKPLVIYEENKEADLAEFNVRTRGMDFIFTLNRGYWDVKKDAISTIAFLTLASTCLVAGLLLIHAMPILCLVVLSASAIFAGTSLFKAFKQSETPDQSTLIPAAFAI